MFQKVLCVFLYVFIVYGSCVQTPECLSSTRGGGGGTPIKKGRDSRREISNETLKGTNLGVA